MIWLKQEKERYGLKYINHNNNIYFVFEVQQMSIKYLKNVELRYCYLITSFIKNIRTKAYSFGSNIKLVFRCLKEILKRIVDNKIYFHYLDQYFFCENLKAYFGLCLLMKELNDFDLVFLPDLTSKTDISPL